MRVVYLNPVGEMGGAERSLLATIAAVRRQWPSAELVLVAGTDGLLLDRARESGVTVHLLPLPAAVQGLGDSGLRGKGRVATAAALGRRLPAVGLGAWDSVRRLRALLRRLRPDLVHSNGIKSHALSTLAAPRGVPVLWHVHDYLGQRPVVRWLLRAVPRPTLAMANSQSVADDARRVLRGVPVEVVLNAIDTDRFTPGPGDGPSLDRLAGLPPAPPGVVRVGLVATYARWKGQDVFLRAAALVGPAVRCYIVGSPIYRTAGSQFAEAELHEMANQLGVADRVGFVPYQEDTAAVYRALDVVVHASTRPEPFGLTIVEAMSCGRPTVVAAAGGAAELFTDGVDAVGHAPGDAASLAGAIGRLAADAGLRERIGAAARRTAVARFGLDRYGREVAAVYRRVTARVS
ncbi:MAG TPA: glycosyltransferase family 4 protein [Fimbriiglobus sp.]|nr:glycosyltransferase family 4 protein [Fimbriiglobus sp.]